jgi:hypothetical protein
MLLGGGVLGLALVCSVLAYAVHPLLAPVAVVGLVGAAALVWRPEAGILLMFAMVLFKPQALVGVFSINTAVAGLLAALVFLYVVVGHETDFLRSNQLLCFVLIGVVTVINWYFAGSVDAPAYLDVFDHTTRSMFRLVFQFTMLLFAVAFLRTPRHITALTGLFMVALFVTIPGAVSRSYSDPTLGSTPETMRAAAVAGVQAAENANRLAFIALMGISLVWYFVRDRSTLIRLAGAGAMGVLVLAVFLSGSRSGVLNLGLLLLLILVQTRPKAGHIVGFAVLLIACALIAYLLVPQPILDRLLTIVSSDDGRLKGATESTSRRLMMVEAGLRLFAENPLIGTGIGNFRWMTAFEPKIVGAAAHNAYLLALAEGGVLLLAVYLFLFYVTLRDLRWVTRVSAQLPGVPLRWLALATKTNLILLLMFSIFAEAWKEFYFVLILATTAVLVRIYRRAAATATPVATAG